jgi:hypothetical protein
MKKLIALAFCLTISIAHAQPGMRGSMGGPPPGPHFGGDMAKIFGENSAFSADMEMQSSGGKNGNTTMPGKIAALDGKSRFEMNMSEMKGSQMSPQNVEQMKQMGMDMSTMVMISRPDKKITYVLYPGMKAYFEQPIRDPNATKSEADFKIETTELGKDSVDGHPCIKNKVVVTDNEGKAHESTVWNATDLKKFPVKIQTTEEGTSVTMLFKNVKLEKPETTQFEPPADFQKHSGMAELMREEMMKHMGGMGRPPGQN